MKWVVGIFIGAFTFTAVSAEEPQYWMKITAKDKYERSEVANTGVSIEHVTSEDLVAIGTEAELQAVRATGRLLSSFRLMGPLDFPPQDSEFHNYSELLDALKTLASENPDFITYEVIGKSLEGRDLVSLRFSLASKTTKPAVVFLGTHHAREHLSTEVPLLLAQWLAEQAKKGDADVLRWLETREIYIVPMVNPDGVEHDIENGKYRAWRKNRRLNKGGVYGVDLNRNYGFQWGTGGSSKSPSSDVFMGPEPFSEPETQAIRDFVQARPQITTLLSFHTFSELILYPWGHKYDGITDPRALKVHETMAKTMAQWNRYTPQQASDLYIASGDTTDWAYGSRGIISFTFELDPKMSLGTGGFYPGQAVIQKVFQKNLKPCLYLIEHADNPYRVIDSPSRSYGFSSRILDR